jgi:hypothetical protein
MQKKASFSYTSWGQSHLSLQSVVFKGIVQPLNRGGSQAINRSYNPLHFHIIFNRPFKLQKRILSRLKAHLGEG